jgi:hypothetical protein
MFIFSRHNFFNRLSLSKSSLTKCNFTKKFQIENIRKFSTTSRYPETFEYALKNPESFWDEQAKHIDFFKPYDKVFEKNTKLNSGNCI